MEFHEKLQQLRKRKGLTQEQLAEKLYVSRTAVSKWESGRGYPNLESLKAISALFSVSIDDLLSGGELIVLAETENRANIRKLSALAFAVPDMMAAALWFLPLFGEAEGAFVRAVTLSAYTGVTGWLRALYWVVMAALPALGGAGIYLGLRCGERALWATKRISLGLHAAGVLLFAVSRQPYGTAFLFLLFAVKTVLLLTETRRT